MPLRLAQAQKICGLMTDMMTEEPQSKQSLPLVIA